jgi:hypothetical protein
MARQTPIDPGNGSRRRSPALRIPGGKPVPPGEEEARLEALVESYVTEHRPRSAAERYFALSLALCDWRRRRYTRVETAMLRHLARRKEATPRQLAEAPAAFTRLYQANDRAYRAALDALRELQGDRPTRRKPRS